MIHSLFSFAGPAIQWGPTAYYGLGVLNTLLSPVFMQKFSEGCQFWRIEDRFPELHEKEPSLRKNIHVFKMKRLIGQSPAAALGTNFCSKAVLVYASNLEKCDRDAFDFILKHEISHIHSSDGFTASTLAALSAAVTAFALPTLQMYCPYWARPLTFIIPYLVASNVNTIYMSIREARADDFAYKHATKEELNGIYRFLTIQLEVQKQLHKTYPRIFDQNGGPTLLAAAGDTHRPIQKRIELAKAALQKRFSSEPEKISDWERAKIKAYHIHYFTHIGFSKDAMTT